MEINYSTKFLFLITFLTSAFFGENTAQVFPTLTNHKIPSPAPAPPGDSFTPEMSGTANNDAPTCAEWTRTAGPDESMVITGINFSSYTDEDKGKDTRFSVYGSNGVIKEAKIQRLDGDKAIITLDEDMPNWSMYLLWPGNEKGYGSPIAINQTDAWWIGPEKTTSGANISVYGRNLSQHNDTLTSFVYIKALNGGGRWAEVNDVNPYKIGFTVPSDLVVGEYEVWTHNGHGGEYGWSGPLKLTIKKHQPWTNVVFNVKDFGAMGNGISDDTGSIQKAINAAEKSFNSTVYFPNGTYVTSNTLYLKSNIKYEGESKNNSSIICGPEFTNSAWGMLYAQYVTNYEISNLSLSGNYNFRGNPVNPIYLRGSTDGLISNVEFSFQDHGILDLHLAENIHLKNSEFIGMISFLGNCSQLFINDCDFYLTNDTELALHSWGGVGVSLINSTCQDFDNSNPNNGSGWGKGRFFVATGNFGSGYHTYIANNKTQDLAVRESNMVDQNSGEQFLWEGFSTVWSGSVVSSSPLSTTLTGFSESLEKSKYAVITKGRGFGQSRRIITANGSTVSLENPWNVPPDKTSTIAVGHFADRIVMYNNYIDGKASNVSNPNHNASSGIQPYGGIQNFIADNNTINEVRAGLANWATQHKVGIDPNFFSLFTNNKVTNSRWGIQNGVDMVRPEGPAIFGATFRNNKINNTVESGIVNTVIAGDSYVFDSFIYENNDFSNVKKGFSTGGDAGLPNGFSTDGRNLVNQVFYKNIFVSRANSFNYGIKITPKIALRDNSIEGFISPYLANLTEPIIEAPIHVVEISGNANEEEMVTTSIDLLNSGILPVKWEATLDVTWLTLSVDNGIIKDERDSQKVVLEANPSGLAEGHHIATITVTVNNKIKKYSVLFKINSSTASGVNFPASINLNTGSAKDVTLNGETYIGDVDLDTYYSRSGTFSNASASVEDLYQTERYSKQLEHAIPLPNGIYTVQTYHNELWFGWAGPIATEGRRVFDISLEGILMKNDFDIFVEGSNRPTILSFENIEVTDGVLDLKLSASANNASISGISIEHIGNKPNESSQWRISSGRGNQNVIKNSSGSDMDELVIALHPNPTTSGKTKLFINREISLYSILFHNMSGQLVKKIYASGVMKENGEYYLSVDDMQEGVYLVSLLTESDLVKQLRLIIP